MNVEKEGILGCMNTDFKYTDPALKKRWRFLGEVHACVSADKFSQFIHDYFPPIGLVPG